MTELDRLMNTPVYRLTLADLSVMPEDERSSALRILFDMAKWGDLAMHAMNPLGTTYEVVWDTNGGWKLSPICSCGNEKRFVEAYDDYYGI